MKHEQLGRAVGAALAVGVLAGTAAMAFGTESPTGTTSATSTPTVTPTETPGFGACTPGFWKTHLDQWSGISPDQTLGEIFTVPASLSSFSDVTAEDALSFGGGSGVDGAARILFRAAVASVLNAYTFGDDPNAVVDTVNDALASGSRSQMIATATVLDDANNAQLCPL
ncbi:MAG TPA: hypothetical protein VIP77_23365 [Jiangellaceae bacterium]